MYGRIGMNEQSAVAAEGPPVVAPGWPRRSWRALRLLVLRVLVGLALGSALVVGVLRWVDPPTSSFMVRQSFVAWRIGRPPPYLYHAWEIGRASCRERVCLYV